MVYTSIIIPPKNNSDLFSSGITRLINKGPPAISRMYLRISNNKVIFLYILQIRFPSYTKEYLGHKLDYQRQGKKGTPNKNDSSPTSIFLIK